MGSFSIWHWLIILVVVITIFGTRRFTHIDVDSLQSHLHKESGRMPVYSAETTTGKEAEFIRDQLPKRIPPVIVVFVAAVFCAAVWWFTR